MTSTSTAPVKNDGWGNPAQSTFAKRLIRQVIVDDHRVNVHKDLVPIVEHLLSNLVQTDLVIDALEGYPAEPRGLGLHLTLAPANPRMVADVMGRFGFTAEDEDMYVWGLSHADAIEAGKAIDQEPTEQPADAPDTDEDAPAGTGEQDDALDAVDGDPTGVITAEVRPGWHAILEEEGWYPGLPATRDLVPGTGQTGRDVVFVQAYLDVPRTGRYDAATVNAVGYFLGRRGLPADGAMTNEAWKQLIPRVRPNIYSGEHGRYVRVLSAAMIAAGHLPVDYPVSPRYGRDLQRIIRDMQEARGGTRTGRITSVEWTYLLGYPWVG